MSEPVVNRALVYICRGADEAPIGCGALVEGHVVATCRHVWEAACNGTDDDAPIIVSYPFADPTAGPTSHPGVLVDDCVADEKIAPDLVLLSAEQAPPDVAVLALPAKPAAEYGEAYAHAYFARLDDTQDFPGHISPSITARGHRNFSGPSETQYWPEPGSSGCPTFLRQNSLFAGVMRIAEIGANLGRSQLREAVIVPASTIRRHVTRIAFNRAAQALGAEPDRFANVRKHVCALDLPVSGISRVVGEIICDMRGAGGGFEPEPPPSRPSPDSTAAIQASRDKVHALQPDAALDILDARIAEKQEAYTADVVPLLVERARFLRLTYDREAARTTLGEIARLLPDDVWCRVEFGDLWWIDGARTQAAEAFRDALTVAVRTGDTSRIALCHDRIGGVLVAQGDRAGALTAFRDSLAIAQRLAQADPGNAEWQRDLSVSHDRIGGVLVAQGDRAGALTAFRDSLAIRQRLAQADPGNAEWQRDLSVSHDRIGGVLVAQGDRAGALTAFRDSLAIRQRLAQADPGNAEWQRDLSVSHDRIGGVLVAQGDRAGALTAFRDSLAIAQRLAQADPGNAEWQRDLSVSHDRIGGVLVAQGDRAGALTAFRDSLAIRQRLAQADPGNAEWQRDLSVSHDRIGGVLVAQGDRAGALTAFRDSLAIAQRLAQADPGNAEWQRDLSVSYNKVGDVLVAQGDRAGALTAFRDSLAIAQRLAQADPGNAEWQVDVLWVNWRLASAGDEPARRWGMIVGGLRSLAANDKLTAEQAGWLSVAETNLASLDHSGTGLQEE